jgi:hypothetical protein
MTFAWPPRRRARGRRRSQVFSALTGRFAKRGRSRRARLAGSGAAALWSDDCGLFRNIAMRFALLAVALAAFVAALPAHSASTLYRVVQPDGKVVYTNERVPGAQPVRPDDVPPPPPTTLPPAGPADVPRDVAPQGAGAPRIERAPVAPKPAGR